MNAIQIITDVRLSLFECIDTEIEIECNPNGFATCSKFEYLGQF